MDFFLIFLIFLDIFFNFLKLKKKLPLFGHFWIVWRAFKVNYGWGFVCMVVGWIGPLAFAIEHWKLAKVPLLLLYFGTILVLFGHFSLIWLQPLLYSFIAAVLDSSSVDTTFFFHRDTCIFLCIEHWIIYKSFELNV